MVNPDSIRLALHGQPFISSAEPIVWATAHLMVSSLFLAGHSRVILDATSITEHRRRDWLSQDWTCEYVCFDTPVPECKRRVVDRGHPDLLPIIDRMAKSLEWPSYSLSAGDFKPVPHDENVRFLHWRETPQIQPAL